MQPRKLLKIPLCNDLPIWAEAFRVIAPDRCYLFASSIYYQIKTLILDSAYGKIQIR